MTKRKQDEIEDLMGNSPVETQSTEEVDNTNIIGESIMMDDDRNIIIKDIVEEKESTEEKELTEEEKKQFIIQTIQNKNNNFSPKKNPTKVVGTHVETNSLGVKKQVKDRITQTNIIKNSFGVSYSKSRRTKNNIRKASRKANR